MFFIILLVFCICSPATKRYQPRATSLHNVSQMSNRPDRNLTKDKELLQMYATQFRSCPRLSHNHLILLHSLYLQCGTNLLCYSDIIKTVKSVFSWQLCPKTSRSRKESITNNVWLCNVLISLWSREAVVMSVLSGLLDPNWNCHKFLTSVKPFMLL